MMDILIKILYIKIFMDIENISFEANRPYKISKDPRGISVEVAREDLTNWAMRTSAEIHHRC